MGMNDRASTLLRGRRERIERALGRAVQPSVLGVRPPITEAEQTHLREEAHELYWNELEWEHITEEERLDEGSLTELIFPGFLAFIRGLLLREAMPDSQAPANPRPEIVEDILEFLCGRVVELEESLPADDEEMARREGELRVTSRLIDLVLFRFYDLSLQEMESVEAAASLH
jgi:hypothetical protein